VTKSEAKSSTAGSPKPSAVRVLLARICSDPWRKGTSIALAILLWYFLDSRLTKETTIVCELHVVDAEKTLVSDPSGPDRGVLDFRLSTREYTSKGFRAAPGDRQVTQVVLHFQGPANLIDKIQPARETFHVRAKALAGETFFEFDKSMIQGDRDLEQALVKMEPSRIALDVERNDKRPVNLSRDKVLVLTPQESNGDTPYRDRLLLDRAVFKPNVATLFGTQSDLAQVSDEGVFELDLSSRANDFNGNEIKGKLKLRTFKDADGLPIEVGCDTTPDITVPLRPRYDRFGLFVKVAPDLLSTTYTLEDFEPVENHKVNLRVNSNVSLAAEISRLDAAQQKEWVDQNLRVLVHVPKDIEDPTRAIEGRLWFVKHPELVRGRDYDFDMLPISLRLKDKNN